MDDAPKEELGYLTEKGANTLLDNPAYNCLPVKVKPSGYANNLDISDTDGTVLGRGCSADCYKPKITESELGQAEQARMKWVEQKKEEGE